MYLVNISRKHNITYINTATTIWGYSNYPLMVGFIYIFIYIFNI